MRVLGMGTRGIGRGRQEKEAERQTSQTTKAGHGLRKKLAQNLNFRPTSTMKRFTRQHEDNEE